LDKHYYIAVEGVIGVGKTTLARMCRPIFEAQVLLEVFEENPFLARFYQDRKRYAFQTQIFFLLSRFQQQHEAVPAALTRGNLISDYTFDKDSIFARLNVEGDELAMYERVHAILATKIRQPDLVVYLRADPDTLMERIALRDRPYERSMDREYIEALARTYDDFMMHYSEAPVLTIDADRIDFVRRPLDLDSVIDQIRTKLELGPYQQPLFDGPGAQ
jgi:deoxyguanosine kinase